ncbi:MAG: enoyl-CoA hydratase/isomerase family protein [Deltaproteobacteria bacterium]|nr:enoyl-CoA hydratase/isomerase family protein [Deltaproteobacteria bacterium]
MLKTHVANAVGFACLDRPEALNTLDLELVSRLHQQLAAWQADPGIAVIVLRGEGPRAFCAGGDVKAVRIEAANGNTAYGIEFFTREYRLDFAIHESIKPIVAIAHGFTMGGGLGLLAGATCRMVTTSSVLSMPEQTIGLFPDVGGSYFLNDLPGKLGLFLALTGARVNAADALSSGLADSFVPDDKIGEFCSLLQAAPWSPNFINDMAGADANRRQLFALATRFSERHVGRLPAPVLMPRLDRINSILAGEQPMPAFTRLLNLAHDSDAALARPAADFARGSPTSSFVIFEQLKRGKNLGLGGCLRMELDLAMQCSQRHDFAEGVRALLVDKDRNPKWQPETLDAVTPEWIAEHFQSPWARGAHPLKDL